MTDADVRSREQAIDRIPGWVCWWQPPDVRLSVEERQTIARALLKRDKAVSGYYLRQAAARTRT